MTSEPLPPIDRVPALAQQLYRLVAELEQLFPGCKFTPDGHLGGSIGEVIAAHRFVPLDITKSVDGHSVSSYNLGAQGRDT